MEIAYQTDIGQERKDNQDYVGVFHNQDKMTFAIVADGIGGHQGGDVASSMAVSHIGYHFEKTTFDNSMEIVRWLSEQVKVENDQIIKKATQFKDLQGMGTTVVAAVFFEDQIIVANIGDSRGYLARKGSFDQLTEDHSLVNELVKKGAITKKEAQNHPQKNIITRTLGISAEADIDVNLYHLQANDQLLLCTDGLSNVVSNDSMSAVLQEQIDVKEKCSKLIKMANQAGAPDNVTVLIAENSQEAEE